jgi:hypothetical protein
VPLLTPRTPAEKPPGLFGSTTPSTPETASDAVLPLAVEVAVPSIAAGRTGPNASSCAVFVTSMSEGPGDVAVNESLTSASGTSSANVVPKRSRPAPAL